MAEVTPAVRESSVTPKADPKFAPEAEAAA